MRKTKKTFTKKWMQIILTVALVDIQLTYVLALLDKVAIAETLAIALVTEVVGTMLGYMAKSFFENKESERHKLDQQIIDIKKENSNDL